MASTHSGPNRRKRQRRDASDRRDVHRADGKVPRRSGKGRRKGEKFGLHLKDLAQK